jgi:hypothetical protein
VRIVAGAAVGLGDGDIIHGLNGKLPRLRASERVPCASTASAIWSPTRMTGLSAVMGSWKIMAMREPRNWRMESAGKGGEIADRAVFGEEDVAGNTCLRRKQAHDGEGRDRLAGAGFSDQAEDFAGSDREA